ncbi:2-oxo-hept-4-ene-1,7-dioate hydratase [Polaromonas sp. JS666]|uniref:2-oxo-hept-4-ene-1,7-dioate hydratase n=1 Tax=Polaromonas sp. (strain JS666 / ATCC BAA-500) TaxID=296591 RepID=UPI0000463F66|nr:2-oxo-hepta-3-ene-1,7-dioic acid hydratase [Polaromonas sp. JS666]ABE42927.1 2-oxohept-3-enedioate hydratase [Polaromonas sp. JS666]
MINAKQRQDAANALLQAEKDRQPIQQVSKTWPEMEIEDSYAIQQLWTAARVKAGARVVGHKIGLTSKAMQRASKMTEPDYGVLLDDMLYPDGAKIPASRFHMPRLEVELAFVLGKPLGGKNLTVYDVLDATAYVTPALEIIDYRTEVPREICDTIADNAAAAAMVTGGRVVRPMDVDLRWIGATLSKNGVIEESGVSAAVMGHPAMGIVWLANKLAVHGITLEAGHILLAGSFTRPTAVEAGDTIHADFGPLGSIGLSFS